jgi:phosphate starvation-inducible PhoH-like protein
MRGLTFKDSFVILDEAQNTTPGQMKLILTRLNQDSKLIINGDSRQVDIKGTNGLEDAIKRLKWVPGIAMVEFDRNDCVRADIISDIISAYED